MSYTHGALHLPHGRKRDALGSGWTASRDKVLAVLIVIRCGHSYLSMNISEKKRVRRKEAVHGW